MRTLLIAACALVALLLQPAALAQDCPPNPKLDPAVLRELQAKAQDRGILWQLRKDGRTSWLYGTMHIARLEWAVPGPRVIAALRASDVLALELDPRDPQLMAAVRASVPKDAQRVLAGGRGERIAALRARACLPEQAFGEMRPLMQVAILSMTEARREGMFAELGVETVLTGAATSLGKPLVALETPARQLAALAPASDDEEIELVQTSLADLESGKARTYLRRMADMWERGDQQLLDTFVQWCDCLRTPAERGLYTRVNDERNGDMADKLAQLHAQGKTFFAGVGLLHMSGAQALTTLMRARGFDVERVDFTKP
jgi:uncharacterized protein YbaP (TraB family)